MPRKGSRSSRGVTIREGTSERNWYLNAAYVAFAIIGVIYTAFTIQAAGGAAGSFAIALVLFGLALGGLATFGSLFRDSAYLRGTHAGWRPKWWYYIGAPVGTGIVIAFLGIEVLGELGIGLAIMVFAFACLASNVYYLYNRHQYVGVP